MTWREVADTAAGWLDDEEGAALYEHAARVAQRGAFVEIGGYAGKSACWLGAAAADHGSVLFSVDWHRGSPEMAPDRECHDPQMVGPDGFDTLPHFRRNLHAAGLEPYVVPVVGNSATVGRWWRTPIAFLFIDGAHDADGVQSDYSLWSPHIARGGMLAFHDTTDAAIGEVADQSANDGFRPVAEVGTLRIFA